MIYHEIPLLLRLTIKPDDAVLRSCLLKLVVKSEARQDKSGTAKSQALRLNLSLLPQHTNERSLGFLRSGAIPSGPELAAYFPLDLRTAGTRDIRWKRMIPVKFDSSRL